MQILAFVNCVCVCERERERETETERQREKIKVRTHVCIVCFVMCVIDEEREREIKVCTHVCIVCFVMFVTDVLGYLKDRSVCRQTQMKTRKIIDIDKISPLANIFS